MGKRFLFYVKGHGKPIAITDVNENRDIESISEEIADLMNSTEYCQFSTENDGIVIKPGEVIAVYISDLSPNTNKYTPSVKNTLEDEIDKITTNFKNNNESVDFEEEIDETFDSVYSNTIDDNDNIPDEVLDIFEKSDEKKIEIKNESETKPKNISKQPSKTQEKPVTRKVLNGGVVIEVDESLNNQNESDVNVPGVSGVHIRPVVLKK